MDAILKLVSANEIAAQMISFLLLLFLLRIFAWKKFLKILDDRRERIVSEFKKIEDTQAEIAKLKSEYDDKLSGIESASKAKIQEAVSAGKKIAEDVREDAQKEARRILEKAQESIALEIGKAKVELKDKIVGLTMDTAEKILKEKLTEEKDKKMVLDFLKEIEKS
jgi:F-type H+-transporting ATPase subunit b